MTHNTTNHADTHNNIRLTTRHIQPEDAKKIDLRFVYRSDKGAIAIWESEKIRLRVLNLIEAEERLLSLSRGTHTATLYRIAESDVKKLQDLSGGLIE